ncbi:MAG: TatD family hydrolase [Candidatus Bathyarchaeia archaeon]
MNLIDTHAHLEGVNDLKNAIKRAAELGVVAIISVGSDYNSNVWVITESRKYEVEGLRIYPALGLHPWGLDPSKVEETLRFIERNISRAVALGEVGLDYWDKDARKSEDRRELQRKIFRKILSMARRSDKPVSIHSRGAWEDCVEMVIEADVKRAVFHWFSGPNGALKRLLDHGYCVSATPAAAYSKEHRRVIAKVPLENIILETDSPVVYAGEVSEPAHIIKALNAVAEIKGVSAEVVAEETTENAKKIFKIRLDS